jgi:hypothetical protein
MALEMLGAHVVVVAHAECPGCDWRGPDHTKDDSTDPEYAAGCDHRRHVWTDAYEAHHPIGQETTDAERD